MYTDNYPNVKKMLEFPALGDDLRSCSLEMSTKYVLN